MLKIFLSDWEDLKRKVQKTIDNNLKLISMNYVQEGEMIITHSSVQRVTVNYSEIGRSWKNNESPSYLGKYMVVG